MHSKTHASPKALLPELATQANHTFKHITQSALRTLTHSLVHLSKHWQTSQSNFLRQLNISINPLSENHKLPGTNIHTSHSSNTSTTAASTKLSALKLPTKWDQRQPPNAVFINKHKQPVNIASWGLMHLKSYIQKTQQASKITALERRWSSSYHWCSVGLVDTINHRFLKKTSKLKSIKN